MKINGFTYTEEEILDALRTKGYIILPWVWEYKDETSPGQAKVERSQTKVALRADDMPCEKNIWTNVAIREFQKEMRKPPLV